jgi:hypothetical protein
MGRRKIKSPSIDSSFSYFGMQENEVLCALETLARTLNVELRYEKGDFHSGLCRIHEKFVMVIQKDIPDGKKIIILARDLSLFELGKIYVMPQLLAILKQVQEEPIVEQPISLEDK